MTEQEEHELAVSIVKSLNERGADNLAKGGVCDFCDQQPITWRYNVSDFATVRHLDESNQPVRINNTGGWAACTACRALVDARDLEHLILRVLQFVPSAIKDTDLIGLIAADLASTYTQLFTLLDAEQVEAIPHTDA